MQTLADFAPFDSPLGVKIHFLSYVSFLQFATPEKLTFLFLSRSNWSNRNYLLAGIMPALRQPSHLTEVSLHCGSLMRLLGFHPKCVPLRNRAAVTLHCEGQLVH